MHLWKTACITEFSIKYCIYPIVFTWVSKYSLISAWIYFRVLMLQEDILSIRWILNYSRIANREHFAPSTLNKVANYFWSPQCIKFANGSNMSMNQDLLHDFNKCHRLICLCIDSFVKKMNIRYAWSSIFGDWRFFELILNMSRFIFWCSSLCLPYCLVIPCTNHVNLLKLFQLLHCIPVSRT